MQYAIDKAAYAKPLTLIKRLEKAFAVLVRKRSSQVAEPYECVLVRSLNTHRL